MHSPQIEKAIETAALLHKGQVRKGPEQLPYVTHLFTVALLVMKYCKDEAVIVGALLHDTIEDTDYTPAELKAEFGEEVHEIVLGVTEPQDGYDGPYTWQTRKEAYAQGLKEAPQGSLVVAAADKIHNMTSVIEDYQHEHELFVAEFGGSLNDRIAMYQGIADILNQRLESDILEEFNHVFTNYKNFIENVKETTQKDS